MLKEKNKQFLKPGDLVFIKQPKVKISYSWALPVQNSIALLKYPIFTNFIKKYIEEKLYDLNLLDSGIVYYSAEKTTPLAVFIKHVNFSKEMGEDDNLPRYILQEGEPDSLILFKKQYFLISSMYLLKK